MLLDEKGTRRLIRTALEEDLAYGPDITSLATVVSDARAHASVAAREAGVIAGVETIDWTLDAVADHFTDFSVELKMVDGTAVAPGDIVAEIEAPTVKLLTAERTFLNLLCHISGIATATAEWVTAVEGTGCRIRDTRKTLPGLRNIEKYGVTTGGGVNHRMGLGDLALIKDNHVIAADGVVQALRQVRAQYPTVSCQVEVDTLEQFDAVLAELPESILLDNFSVEQCAEAVRRRDERAPEVPLEASGGLSLEVARSYAETGVDFLAVGALTHSVRALDLGLDFR